MAGGGAERVVSILLEEFRINYNVTLVVMGSESSHFLPKNINIRYLNKQSSSKNSIMKLIELPILAYKYKSFCKLNKIDKSFSLLSRSNYINILSKVLFRNKAKTIVSERGTPSMYYGYNNLQSKINKFLIKLLYPLADLIITNSCGNKNDLIKNFNIKKNIISIPNPINIKMIEKFASENVDFNNDKFTFVTIGRLDQGKNHELMIDALAEINLKDVQLIIIGEGELMTHLKEKVSRLKMQDKVSLFGFDSNPYKYLSKSDCFVFTSNYEGFPNVLVEALACELPVISTDCLSGPREILAPNTNINLQEKNNVEYSKYGILIPVKDKVNLKKAMKSIIENENMRTEYVNKAKIRAFDFEKGDIITKYIEAIEA